MHSCSSILLSVKYSDPYFVDPIMRTATSSQAKFYEFNKHGNGILNSFSLENSE